MLRQSRLSFLDSSDNHSKMILERIISVEKNFGEMCSNFGSFTRKTAGLRDKCDELAKTIHNYSEIEANNKTLSSGLSNFSKALTLLADYKDLEVQRLELKVTGEISQYEVVCKNTKDELKSCLLLKEKELVRKRQLDQIRQRNPRDRKKQSTTEAEIRKANLEITKSSKEMDTIIESFEQRKLQDLKNVLLDFISIEIKMHAKALEVLTATYQDILNDKPAISMTDITKNRSQSMTALNNIFQTPRRPSLLSQTPPDSPIPTSSNKGKILKAESLDQLRHHDNTNSTNSSASEQDEESESEKFEPPLPHVRRPFQF